MTPQRFQRLKSVIEKRQSNITVVLENVHNPNNVSAVMRTCDAVGIQEIYVMNTTSPPVKNWGRRSNAGTAGWLDVYQYENPDALIRELQHKYDYIFASMLKPASKSIFDLDLTQSIAFVFGNEREGISDSLAAIAHTSFIIPQVGVNPSLNISASCAVTLYETFRQKKIAGHYESPGLDPTQLKSLSEKWGLDGGE